LSQLFPSFSSQVTGRILVLPPNAVMYLLHMNKKWKDNKSSMEDFFDFDKLRAAGGLETMSMQQFLESVARPGLLAAPLPGNDTALIRQPLWSYLKQACYVRQWLPGKQYIGFNITMSHSNPDLPTDDADADASSTDASSTDAAGRETLAGDSLPEGEYIGDFSGTDPKRLQEFSIKGVIFYTILTDCFPFEILHLFSFLFSSFLDCSARCLLVACCLLLTACFVAFSA
jgi:hypothetical protein